MTDISQASMLSALPVFSQLDAAGLDDLWQQGRLIEYDKDSQVFRQEQASDQFFVLLKGLIKVVRTMPNGSQLLVRFALPGDVIGIAPALRRRNYPATAISVTHSAALAWPEQSWESLTAQYPCLLHCAQDTVSRRLSEADDRLLEIHSLEVEQRLAHSLLRLIRQVGQNDAQGTSLSIPVTRQDLAELAGTTLYTASRIVSSWDNQGLLQAGRKQITIADLDNFARAVLERT
ncbi:Crp/Fnr family transcriptional regulator [Alcaligenes sp. SDU_A2]|uniref:Crp/Fnr family transcriptional regulator n=1 Tax=Alcaligenes sp. SDU_A2 TaxID=3136634 RepID=UPI00311E95CA